jgi:hypothetical protein
MFLTSGLVLPRRVPVAATRHHTPYRRFDAYAIVLSLWSSILTRLPKGLPFVQAEGFACALHDEGRHSIDLSSCLVTDRQLQLL